MRLHPFMVVTALLSASLVARADTFTTNLLNNPGAETGSVAGWVVGGNSNPGVDTGTFNPGINPHSGSYDFYGSTGSLGTLSQTVSILTQGVTISQINLGMVTADLSFWEQGLNQGTPSDSGRVILTFLNSLGNTISFVSSGEIDSHNLSWQNFSSAYLVPMGTQSITYEMDFVRHVGNDNDSYIDDNSLILVTATPLATVTPEPSSIALFGTGLLGLVGVVRKRFA